MSQIRLYVDEDASQNIVVNSLRSAGFDVVTAKQVGLRGATDEAHLAKAVAEVRTLYTLNAAHFARLHKEALHDGRRHAGIIIVPRQKYGPSEKVRRLTALLETTSAEEMRDAIRFI